MEPGTDVPVPMLQSMTPTICPHVRTQFSKRCFSFESTLVAFAAAVRETRSSEEHSRSKAIYEARRQQQASLLLLGCPAESQTTAASPDVKSNGNLRDQNPET